MKIFSYIDLKWFLLAFAFGLLLVYCTMPKPTIIVKYPTPENSDKMVYEDDVENCYKFKTTEVECNKDAEDLPIEKNFEHFSKKRS